jgi:hypothetical protein
LAANAIGIVRTIPVDERRNEVPLQKASMAEPFNLVAMIWPCVSGRDG